MGAAVTVSLSARRTDVVHVHRATRYRARVDKLSIGYSTYVCMLEAFTARGRPQLEMIMNALRCIYYIVCTYARMHIRSLFDA